MYTSLSVALKYGVPLDRNNSKPIQISKVLRNDMFRIQATSYPPIIMIMGEREGDRKSRGWLLSLCESQLWQTMQRQIRYKHKYVRGEKRRRQKRKEKDTKWVWHKSLPRQHGLPWGQKQSDNYDYNWMDGGE